MVCLLPFQGLGSSMVGELLPLPFSGLRGQHGVGLCPSQGGTKMVWELLPLAFSGLRLQYDVGAAACALFREGPGCRTGRPEPTLQSYSSVLDLVGPRHLAQEGLIPDIPNMVCALFRERPDGVEAGVGAVACSLSSGLRLQHGVGAVACALSRFLAPAWCRSCSLC